MHTHIGMHISTQVPTTERNETGPGSREADRALGFGDTQFTSKIYRRAGVELSQEKRRCPTAKG